MGERAHGAKPLIVRTRRVVGARSTTSESTVHCPAHDLSIPAPECLACADCEGRTDAPEGTYLSCVHPAATRAAFAELMRQPLFAADADRTPLVDVMTRDVLCVLPDLPVEELRELLVDHNIGGVPVVDEAGRPIGMVSKSDLVDRFEASVTVSDIMMPMAFVLLESATLTQAAAIMAFESIHRIPVVSNDGCVVGIVTSLDVARWLANVRP